MHLLVIFFYNIFFIYVSLIELPKDSKITLNSFKSFSWYFLLKGIELTRVTLEGQHRCLESLFVFD